MNKAVKRVSCFTAKKRMMLLLATVTRGPAHARWRYDSLVRPDRVKAFLVGNEFSYCEHMAKAKAI